MACGQNKPEKESTGTHTISSLRAIKLSESTHACLECCNEVQLGGAKSPLLRKQTQGAAHCCCVALWMTKIKARLWRKYHARHVDQLALFIHVVRGGIDAKNKGTKRSSKCVRWSVALLLAPASCTPNKKTKMGRDTPHFFSGPQKRKL